MAVAFQAVGAGSAALGGALPVPWPVHLVDDIGLLFVSSSPSGVVESLSTPNGFTYLNTYSTGSGTTGVKISVFWARATTNAMASPTVTLGADYKYAVIATFRGAITTGNPIDVYAGGTKPTASASASITGVTTTVANSLIVNAIAHDLDAATAFVTSYTNANLTNVVKHFDLGTENGSGGGLSIASGAKATAGATGSTDVALLNTSINAVITLALIPAPRLTSFVNTFEGGTDGVNITNGNSGGASGLQLISTVKQTGMTITFSNLRARNTLSMRAYFPVAAAGYGQWDWSSSVRSVVRFYIQYQDVVDPGYFELIRMRNVAGSGHAGMLAISGGNLLVYSLSGNVNSGLQILPDTWYRLELAVTKGTTTSNGRVELMAYSNDSLTPLYSYDSGATVNMGASDLSAIRFGAPAGPTSIAMTAYYDDISVKELATGFIGPSVQVVNSISNNFEGGTDGVAITNANSGGTSGTPLLSTATSNSTTFTYSNVHTRGTMAMKVSYTIGGAGYATWSWSSSVRTVMRFYVYFEGPIDNGFIEVMRIKNTAGDAYITSVALSARHIVFYSIGASQSTSLMKIQPDSWYRFEVAVTQGTTTSNGRIEIVVYDKDSITPFYSYDSGATVNTGITNLESVRLGSPSGPVSNAMVVYYDDLAVQELPTGFVGPSATGTTYDPTQFLSFF
jgi:hypothetical protein